MATVLDLIDNLQKWNVKGSVLKVFSDNADHITTLIQAQMYEGKRGDGRLIQSGGKNYKNPAYAEKKKRMNPAPGLGNPDLYLTGSFYRLMKTRVMQQDIETISTDLKSESLLSKYGEQIFVAGVEARENFNQSVFLPDFEVEMFNKTGLTMN